MNPIKAKLILLSDQILVSGFKFLLTLFLVRFLGVDDFGLFATGWMLVLFFSSLQLAYIISPLYTLFPKHLYPKQYLKSVHSIQILFTVITLVSAIASLKIIMFIKPEWFVSGILWSLPLVIALFGLQDFYRRLNILRNRPLLTFISDLVAYGLQPISIYGLYYFEALNIHNCYLVLAVLYGISSIYYTFIISLEFNTSQLILTIKENWYYSRFLLGTALLQWFTSNFFIIAAGGLLAPAAIGIIRIAQNVLGVLNVLFLTLENIVPLKAAQILAKLGPLPTLSYFKKVFIYGGVLTGLTLVCIALGRDLIIFWLYGEQYLKYSNILLGFTLLYVFIFINTIFGFVIKTFELNHIFLISYVITTAFSVFSAKPIISQWGLQGVILGLISIQILNVVVYYYYLKTKFIEL
tara:strand:- start:8986 stop:10212 length:1227 start_codon:yes stop_codon:yes gene_type:complete